MENTQLAVTVMLSEQDWEDLAELLQYSSGRDEEQRARLDVLYGRFIQARIEAETGVQA